MARFYGSLGHSVLIWIPHFLQFCSFGIMLGGIAALQNECGSGLNNQAFGTTSYLAAVPCNRFFSFDWFILFFQLFVWIVILPLLFTRRIHKARNAVNGLLVVASILLCALTNTWYRGFSGLGQDFNNQTFSNRSKAVFSGSLVGAVADLFLILFIGLYREEGHDDTEGRENVHVYAHRVGQSAGTTQEQFQTSYVPTGAMPGATHAHTTTTTAAAT